MLTLLFINCILHGIYSSGVSENLSEQIYSYDEYLKNDSVEILDFNQSIDFLNVSSNITLGNLTEEHNSSVSDLVVTEEEKLDLDQNYLSFTISDEDICSCDLNLNACDINCCCDPDCSEEDIKVFSKCHSQSRTPDPNYCYQKDIIFRNNTAYKMQKDPHSSLFCIVHDNLKQHLRFRELPVIKSHRDLDLLLKYQSKHISSWSDDQKSDESNFNEMRAGFPLFIDSASEKQKTFEKHWKLPSSCFTRMCSCYQEVKYLEDFNSHCSRQIHNLEEECKPNTYLSADLYSNFCVKSESMSLNLHAQLNDLITHTMVTDYANEPHQQLDFLCIENNARKIKYSTQQKICSNVISAVHFTVTHNGYYGIQSISANFDYIDLNLEADIFLQHFNVTFKWNNVTEIKRSGNPGYHIGFPILIGTNISAMELEDTFEIQVDPAGLSVLEKDARSACSSKRRTVKFGKNLRTSCIFRFSRLPCKDLQERILHILLSSNRKQVFVGIFGNANGSNADDWIEAYHEYPELSQNNKTCPVIRNIRINVVFAAVGTVINPQYKILGVGYHYGKPQAVELPCSVCPDLELSTSVSFFDVTEPAIPHYPKVPSIKANLPSDFFYPFLYGKATKNMLDAKLVILFFLLLMLTYIITLYIEN
ncbi:tectonic-1 [Trichonephila inaurata madagascariensis]|uniref:Tectonic-1 n=1 Tax=Trichonephila inaurata madagascariensis TaxID=2747483 RepID=A0A8X6X282_9ARAC|nr:tectonic-1 [Trichonephila inaurata madagascariensis]